MLPKNRVRNGLSGFLEKSKELAGCGRFGDEQTVEARLETMIMGRCGTNWGTAFGKAEEVKGSGLRCSVRGV